MSKAQEPTCEMLKHRQCITARVITQVYLRSMIVIFKVIRHPHPLKNGPWQMFTMQKATQGCSHGVCSYYFCCYGILPEQHICSIRSQASTNMVALTRIAKRKGMQLDSRAVGHDETQECAKQGSISAAKRLKSPGTLESCDNSSDCKLT